MTVLGELAKFEEGVVISDDLSLCFCFDGHQCLPHVVVDLVALVGYLVLGHQRPVLLDDNFGIGTAEHLELRVLRVGQAFGQAVDVSQRGGFEIDILLRGSVVCPYGVEHEAENDGVSGAEDAELPADEVVVLVNASRAARDGSGLS